MRKLTQIEAVKRSLTAKRGKTAVQVAEATGIDVANVRVYLSTLTKDGTAKVVGTQPTGARPANLYVIAA